MNENEEIVVGSISHIGSVWLERNDFDVCFFAIEENVYLKDGDDETEQTDGTGKNFDNENTNE